jgi:hypothetical protein
MESQSLQLGLTRASPARHWHAANAVDRRKMRRSTAACVMVLRTPWPVSTVQRSQPCRLGAPRRVRDAVRWMGERVPRASTAAGEYSLVCKCVGACECLIVCDWVCGCACVCANVCADVFVCLCVRACVCVCACVRAFVCVRACFCVSVSCVSV